MGRSMPTRTSLVFESKKLPPSVNPLASFKKHSLFPRLTALNECLGLKKYNPICMLGAIPLRTVSGKIFGHILD